MNVNTADMYLLLFNAILMHFRQIRSEATNNGKRIKYCNKPMQVWMRGCDSERVMAELMRDFENLDRLTAAEWSHFQFSFFVSFERLFHLI